MQPTEAQEILRRNLVISNKKKLANIISESCSNYNQQKMEDRPARKQMQKSHQFSKRRKR